MNAFQETIIALATPPGIGAIGVIRLSGDKAIQACNEFFHGKDLSKQKSHTIHFGTIRDGDKVLDEVLVSLFIAPTSFTKENCVEISTHGSQFIINSIIQLFIRKGVRSAKPGEFTQRAFLNGQFDLAQAEAVADLIASDSEVSHELALKQMRGGFSEKIKMLREQLVHFASMVELELDFGEEDVEFADRSQLTNLVNETIQVISALIESFTLGNVMKGGIPTVIAGKPNAGKSTLLNALLNEEKAIVTDIAGTTRDVIEDEINIEGVKFRFIDTAGLRDTEDVIEAIGVAKSREKMKEASLILYLFDLSEVLSTKSKVISFQEEIDELKALDVPYLLLGNKIDKAQDSSLITQIEDDNLLLISASTGKNVEELKSTLLEKVGLNNFKTGNTVVTNSRHYESLVRTKESLLKVIEGIDSGITNDFVAMDIRQSLHYLGEITGQVTTDDLLENIFSKFCIGK